MSSVTGNGIEEFFEAVDASREEYERYVNRSRSHIYSHVQQGIPPRT